MDNVAKYFGIIAVVAVLFLVLLIVYAFKKRKNYSIYLGVACIYAAFALVGYTLSLMNRLDEHYLFSMIMSTLYFTSIDIMLMFLIMSVMAYTNSYEVRRKLTVFIIIMVLAISDVGMLWTNCFCPVSKQFAIYLTSVPSHPTIPVYKTHWPWHYHLTFTYFMVIFIISILHSKSLSVPKGYKRQYTIPSIAIFAVVFANLIFLLIQTNNDSVLKMIDVSTLLYPFGVAGIFFGFFDYKGRMMVTKFKVSIVDNGFNGVVGFDWENNLLAKNSKADYYFPLLKDKAGKEIEYMSEITGLDVNEADNRICQCFGTDADGNPLSLRCDYIVNRNKYNAIVSKVFYFQDISPETDPLTGFQKIEAFYHLDATRDHIAVAPKAVCIFDINGLNTINATKGRTEGDKAIQSLCELLKARFPKDTLFLRGKEGTVYAICITITQLGAKNITQTIKSDFKIADIDYAVLPYEHDRPFRETMDKLDIALDTIKLLNSKSSRSNIVASLLKTLEETDFDTEDHVKRTTIYAEKLGKRLGLSDYDLSRLKLLTILHDIGKIAIPLEILNKPGRLNDHEFEIMKTHTLKGYEIAKSNKTLKNISKEIKQHHERWDGKGYPDGLEKEAISYLARIVSVVDSFDAMTSDRVYRKALTWDEAKAELRRCAGTQFDPKVTAEFLRMLDEEIHVEIRKNTKEENDIDIPLTSKYATNNVFQMQFGKYTLDEKEYIVEIDKNFTAITGYTMEDITEKKMKQKHLLPEEDRAEYLVTLQKQFAAGLDSVLLEHRIIKKDGNTIYVYCIGKKRFDSSTKKYLSEILIVDCSLTHAAKLGAELEKNRAREQRESWERHYRKDGLTNLLTHTAFENDLEAILLKNEKKVLFMIFDLDGFKKYNDTHGHKAGDEYLILVAKHLEQAMRKDDLCCRLGGDEFAVGLIIDKEESNETIKQRAESLLMHVNGTLTYIDKSNCKFSSGASISSAELDSFDKLYVDADKALYSSKEGEKGTLSFGSSLK